MTKLGNHLAEILNPKLTASARTWLNSVHSLAVIGCLTPKLAESALIEEFVSELLGSTDKAAAADYKTSVAFDIRQKLMQINAAAQLDLDNYSGPLLDKKDRRFNFSDSSAVSTRERLMLILRLDYYLFYKSILYFVRER